MEEDIYKDESEESRLISLLQEIIDDKVWWINNIQQVINYLKEIDQDRK